MKLSIAQIHIDLGQTSKNFQKGLDCIDQAVKSSADMILFPELWTTGFDLLNSASYTIQNRSFLKILQSISDTKNVRIGGSYLLDQNKCIYNVFVLLLPHETPVIYRKRHLFGLMSEKQYLNKGSRYTQYPLGDLNFGFAVCYDLRFPDLFWEYSRRGVNGFLIPAEWPLSRIEHWNLLTRSRALENQSFLVGCNCVGLTGREIFGGSSCLVNPDGTYAAHASAQEEELVSVELERDLIYNFRNSLSIVTDR